MTDRQSPEKTATGQYNRRTFLRRSAGVGASLVVGGTALDVPAARAAAKVSQAAKRTRVYGGQLSRQPNILVICVDQLRQPRWFGAGGAGKLTLPPNIARIANGGVSFANHYTVSNDCTPSRSALVTGLYSRQTGCLVTGQSTLSPDFPTWGTMLRDQGYSTYWYGKWHLTFGDALWTALDGPAGLAAYDFGGGTFPSPNGAVAQGWHVDPQLANQFALWYAESGGTGPWCTTVSFVNPHDITWWFKQTNQAPEEASAPTLIKGLAPNFETPAQLKARNKPDLQLSLIETTQHAFGAAPYGGADLVGAWQPMANLYIKLQLAVDAYIGQVLDALATQPEVAANTIVLFTSDHGEYCGAHGLRGKGAGVYEEGINVPLIIKDLRGDLNAAPNIVREQLTSSVDIAPLLLTLGYGGSGWRSDSRYAHLASRLDIAPLLTDPGAPGREYVLHATDEFTTEFALERYDPAMPLHVTAMRTPDAKLALYENWAPNTSDPVAAGAQSELYEYDSVPGRLEIANTAGRSHAEAALRDQLATAVSDELNAPLPSSLVAAQQQGYADYKGVAAKAAAKLAKHERDEARARANKRHHKA
jgi:arylsulfatase A-like enzyme